MSLRERHQAAPPRPPVKVTVTGFPGYEGDYYVLRLTVGQKGRYEQRGVAKESIKGRVIQTIDISTMRERLLALTLCDASGKREFDESDEDLKILASLPADVAEVLYEAARKASALEEDKSPEELAGNSASGPLT